MLSFFFGDEIHVSVPTLGLVVILRTFGCLPLYHVNQRSKSSHVATRIIHEIMFRRCRYLNVRPNGTMPMDAYMSPDQKKSNAKMT